MAKTRSSRQLIGSKRPVAHVDAADAVPSAGGRPSDMGAALTGVINKQFIEKGFGFIREDQSGREYFFHYEGTKDGTREAFEDDYTEGTRVRFEGKHGPKGWRASAVELVS